MKISDLQDECKKLIAFNNKQIGAMKQYKGHGPDRMRGDMSRDIERSNLILRLIDEHCKYLELRNK